MQSNSRIPNGSIVWKMGKMWGILPPNNDGSYSKENISYSPNVPDGITKIPVGKGSFKRSFQIIGTPPKDTDINIDMGWVNIHLSIINKQFYIETKGGSEAASKRWAMGIPSRRYKHHYNPHHFNTVPSADINMGNFTATTREKQVRNTALWDWLRSEAYIRDKGICWVCNEFVPLRDYDLGHLVDRSNGGNDSLGNCAVMHKRCNSIKPSHHSLEDATMWRLTFNNQ